MIINFAHLRVSVSYQSHERVSRDLPPHERVEGAPKTVGRQKAVPDDDPGLFLLIFAVLSLYGPGKNVLKRSPVECVIRSVPEEQKVEGVRERAFAMPPIERFPSP